MFRRCRAAYELTKRVIQKGDGVTFPKKGDHAEIRRTIYPGNRTGCTFGANKSERLLVGCDKNIPGIDQELPKMSLGERAELTMTSEWAFGEAGVPPYIAPQESLKIDLELVSIRPFDLDPYAN